MMQLNVSAAWYSEIGQRKVNEDTALILQSERLLAAMVADGLGGLGNGDLASQTAAAALKGAFDDLAPLSPEGIEALCKRMNQAVVNLQGPGKRMKSTLAALFYDGNQAVFAHVGDSRIYQFRNGRVQFQTLDHSVSQLAVLAGEIRPQDIRFHVDRSRILRALGEREESFRPEIQLAETAPLPGDAFLLCSDGFWEHLLESEMIGELEKSRDADDWLFRMLRRMRRKHIKGQDNHTAVAVMLG